MEFEHKVGAFDDEGLVVADKEKKDWRGIVISLLVISNIMGAIIVAIILCTPAGDADLNKSKLDFEIVVADQFRIQEFNGTWISDHEIVYVDQNGSIVIFDAEKNKSESMLVKTYDKTLHTMAGFKLSTDRQSILFVSDVREEFGEPKSARYAIFNISSQTVEFLEDIIKPYYQPLKTLQIQYAAWGPKPNSIVFIESNDIYYLPDYAKNTAGKQVRLSGRAGETSDSIKNGIPDSLYRSNIFNQPNEATLWFSSDGRYLAYLSFNETQVEAIPIEFYDNYFLEANNNPKIHYEKYPRAGGVNPHVSVNVVDLTSINSELETNVLSPPQELIKQQQLDPRLGHYVTYVDWLPNNQLLVLWSNRAQSSSILRLCGNGNEMGSLFGGTKNSWKCDLLTTFSQRIPPSTNAKRTILTAFNKNGTRLIFFALPRPDSVIGDHYHVAMLLGEEHAPKYLTHGEFDIDRLISYEPTTDTLYFEVKIGETAERHLYKISSIGQVATRQTKCLTCNLDEPCGYNYAHISPGSKYFVHECLGPSVPSTRMRPLEHYNNQTDDNNGKSTSRYLLGKNEHIENLIRSKQMPIEKYIAIKSNQQVPCDIYMKLYLPTEIEDEKDKRFPLLIESSEIDKRNVWKKFDLDWGKYLTSKKQVIYAKMDCVRTKPRSNTGRHYSSLVAPTSVSTHYSGSEHDEQHLLDSPLFNAKDQVGAIKFLAENTELFPFIDRRRIAIWGPTSTSAYIALATTIEDDSKLIQCTMVTAPITNWRYMNSYAAEHYLGLPWLDSNNLKYEHANLLKRSYEFALRKLLIIHGTADEQVHVQHSMQFIKSLTDHHITGGVLHQMQLYPDVGHSLDRVKRHYYLILDGFVDRCFYQKPIAFKATEWKGKARPKLY